MSRPSRLLVAAALVVGCASAPAPDDPRPAATPATPVVAPDPQDARGDAPASAAKVQHAGGVGHWSVLVASARDALDTPGPDGRPPEFVDAPLARGDDLEVSLLAARGRVPAPSRAADEVLIVVQGPFTNDARACGVLQVEGRPHQLAPGTVALLPAGARGALEPVPEAARSDRPVMIVVARALRPGAGPAGRPWLANIEAALAPQLAPPEGAEPRIAPVAALGERLGLYVLALSTTVLEAAGDGEQGTSKGRVATRVAPGLLAPRVHPGHDEALLFLTGEGNLALGRTSHRVQAGSLVLVPAGVQFYVTNDAPHPGTRALLIAAPAKAGTDVELVGD